MIKSRLRTTENRKPATKIEIIENIIAGNTAIQLFDTAIAQEIKNVNNILQRGSIRCITESFCEKISEFKCASFYFLNFFNAIYALPKTTQIIISPKATWKKEIFEAFTIAAFLILLSITCF